MLIFSSRLSVNVGFFFFFDAAVVTASRHCQTQSHDKKLLNCMDGTTLRNQIIDLTRYCRGHRFSLEF